MNKNTDKKILASITTAVGLMLASTPAFSAPPKWAKKGDKIEKCLTGTVKKGQNDCGTHYHTCSGKAPEDNLVDEWVYVPEGVCEKMKGARIKAVKTIK